MDEALRRLERGDDPLAYAAALRRAGDEMRAQRLVEARVRAGDAAAREALDAWWPVDERVARVVARAEQADDRVVVLNWISAEEDPRLVPVVEPLIARLEAVIGEPGFATAHITGFVRLMRSPAEDRRRRIVSENHVPRLSRARLDADEAASLLARAEFRPSLLLSAIWHAGRARSRACAAALSLHARSTDALVASLAADALEALGVPASQPRARPSLLPGRPFRPAWALDRCPGETRSEETGALVRSAFVDDPLAPLESDEARDVPVEGWLVSVRLDAAHHRSRGPEGALLEARLTRALQASVGDRVGTWGRHEWLLRLEPEVEPRSIAEGLRATVAAAGVTVSVGIARGTTWAASIIAASSARAVAEEEGGDRVRQAD